MAVHVENAARRQARAFADQSLIRLRRHLTKLYEANVRPIMIGGWAVWAHGSPIGSRDADILVRTEEQRTAGDTLGNTDFVARYLEGDATFDCDFYEATNSSAVGLPIAFRYSDVLDGRVEPVTLTTTEGPLLMHLPDATSLLFLKLKAFVDRSHAFHLKKNPKELARLENDVRAYVEREDQEHWARKAAKDMDDVCFLASLPVDERRLKQLLASSGLGTYAIREWARKDVELLRVADEIRSQWGLEAGFVAARFDRVLALLT